MEPSELLRHAVAALERLGVPYLVTGSVATIYYGEPRFTNDIDVVAQLGPHQVPLFCQAFPAPDYYVSEEAAREAIASGGQFNIIHPASGLKIDVMVPAPTPFNRSRFARVVRARPAPDLEANFASPEDVIIKKLEYYHAGGSDKHLRDIAGMLKVSGERIDRNYIATWCARLALGEVWASVLARTREKS
jgi:hypothetical protein